MKIIITLAAVSAMVFLAAVYPAFSVGDVGIRVLDTIVEQYGPVKFDHTLHSQFAENCWQCHHEHSANAASCRDCHALKAVDFKRSVSNPFMPCKNCHFAYDPMVPGMPGLKAAYHRQCFQCHKGMADLGVDPKGCTNMCHAKRG